MSDIRSRLADALRGRCSHDCMFLPERAADALLSLPGIAITDTAELEDFIAEIPDLTCHRFMDTDGYFSVKIHEPREVAQRVTAALLAAAVQAQEEQA